MTMTFETLRVGADNRLAMIQLNRPERMNAVIEQMYAELQQALTVLEDDDGVRCVILTGSVLRRNGVEKQAFCAGADLKEHGAGSRTSAQRRAYIELAHQTTHRLFTFRKPVIAAVNGPARGAGAELAVSCDFLFMADEATIAFPETGLGTFVGGGVTHILPRLVGLARAKELIYAGPVVAGPDAAAIGLATRAVPLARLTEEVTAFATHLADMAPHSLKLAKRLLQREASDLEEALRLETTAILECMGRGDWMEGVRAFADKRKPNFEGS
jgi:enoyl-CoA hydratase